MEVRKIENGNEIVFEVEGRVDTNTAPELEKAVRPVLGQASSIVFDFSKVDYISSAGLRVLLVVQKSVNQTGKLVLRGCNDSIKDLLEITGFDSILTIC